MAMPRTRKEIEVRGQLVGSEDTEWKQTVGRTRPIALPSPLTLRR